MPLATGNLQAAWTPQSPCICCARRATTSPHSTFKSGSRRLRDAPSLLLSFQLALNAALAPPAPPPMNCTARRGDSPDQPNSGFSGSSALRAVCGGSPVLASQGAACAHWLRHSPATPRPQLPASTSGLNFRPQLPASTSGLNFRPPLPASTSGLNFRPPLPASTSGLASTSVVHVCSYFSGRRLPVSSIPP